MKKILYIIALTCIVSLWFAANITSAHTITWEKESTNTGTWIVVTVTEKIPWAWCWKHKHRDIDKKAGTKYYECTVQKGFWQITLMLGNMIKYFTFLAGLWGVLFIVINGILYSMGGIDSGWKDEAKKRITKTLLWLAVLLLSWVILNAVAPWIYTI